MRSCFTAYRTGRKEQNPVPVGDAVEIHDQRMIADVFVLLGKGCRAEQSAFFVVKQDEAYILPSGKAVSQCQNGHNAGRIVIGCVFVCRTGGHQQKNRDHSGEQKQFAQQNGRPFRKIKPDKKRGKGKRKNQYGSDHDQTDKNLIQQKDDKIFRRDEVRKGQTGTGIVVRSVDYRSSVRIADDDIPVFDELPGFFNVHPAAVNLCKMSDKRRFLCGGFSDLIILQKIVFPSWNGVDSHGCLLFREYSRKQFLKKAWGKLSRSFPHGIS